MTQIIKKIFGWVPTLAEMAIGGFLGLKIWQNAPPYLNDFFVKIYDFIYPKVHGEPGVFGYYKYLEQRDEKLIKPVEYATHAIPLLLVSLHWLMMLFRHKLARSRVPVQADEVAAVKATPASEERKDELPKKHRKNSPRRHRVKVTSSEQEVFVPASTLPSVAETTSTGAATISTVAPTTSIAAPVIFSTKGEEVVIRQMPTQGKPRHWAGILWQEFSQGVSITRSPPPAKSKHS